MWFVYILKCRGGSLYTGATIDVHRRFAEHKAGKGGSYTRSHLPQAILYVEKLGSRGSALRREAVIKQMSRAQKLTLIRFHQS